MSRTVQVLLTIMLALTTVIVVCGAALLAALLTGSLWALPACFVTGLILGWSLGKLLAIIWLSHGS